MQNVQMDFITANSSSGEMAAKLMAQGRMDPGAMRPFIADDGKAYMTVYAGGNPMKPESYKTQPINVNATLRRDEWKQLDEAILPIAESRLPGVNHLVSKGLVYNLGNAMGTTVLEWHDISDAMEADLTMDGVTRSKGDRPSYGTNYLPIPIIHVDYEINARTLAASRSLGNPLDTTSAERAARKVAEKLEKMLFTSTSYSFGGGTIQSYVNYTNRNKVTMTIDWASLTATSTQSVGQQIVDDVLKMKKASIDAHFYGPWALYVPSAYETLLDEDYDTTRGNTIRERLQSISGIQDVQVVDTLATGNVLLVQMTSDVVRLVRGMGITNVQWSTEGQFITKYKVMTIQVPQIRSDQDGNCGVTHLAIRLN